MSAKKMTGAKKILDVLSKTKDDMKAYKNLPKVYVVGPTNSGKSSVLNAMLSMQSHKKNKKAEVLTESHLSGTTQTMVTVEQFKIGFKVIDTPGVPNDTTV
jgi:ribosome biogenesis GTPase A